MWRFCDLHNHTTPNEQCGDVWDAEAFVRSCIEAGCDVVSVTDHDHCEHVADAIAAADGSDLVVVPGVEISTDRGHVLVLGPGGDGFEAVRDFVTRVGAAVGRQVALDDVLGALKSPRPGGGAVYAQHLVLIGAHVDTPGSLLATPNALGIEGQLLLATQLHALEVTSDEVLAEWLAAGVKQGPRLTLLRGSDTHDQKARRRRGTWLFLPDVTAEAMRHALALPEASVRLNDPPSAPAYAIESVSFNGGYHDGLLFEFCERANALIGPPNSGKSLVVDALKFAFGMRSDLDEVESVSRRRMDQCMPEGCSVEVRVRTPAGVVPIVRAMGSGRPATPPFRPIIFGQTELTRRAIAAEPAISLLDLHCPEAESLKSAISEAAAQVIERFRSLLADACAALALRNSVTNPQDGLAATKAELERVTGTESIAKLAMGASQVVSWRRRAREAIESWRTKTASSGPSIPAVPAAATTGTDLARFAPAEAIHSVGKRYSEAVAAAASDAATDMIGLLDADEEALDDVRRDVDEKLAAAGFERGSEVEARLTDLKDRIEVLECEERELGGLEASINAGLVELRALHESAATARTVLTDARKDACRAVNDSMRTFFARVDPSGNTQELDRLIEDIKTGTRMRAATRQELRDVLDRFRLLESAIRQAQGRSGTLEGGEVDQDRVVAEALRRARETDIARLACLWPGDGLVLAKRTAPPTPFQDLTEGLRALAIKEISFAASELPVVTDQPEDAVPTRAVYESLVPTIREQRAQRQFIVVSHDANIVVASDVERIWVLQANEDNTPHVGSLFDSRVRQAALEHLEGGQEAFQLRADRYAQFG